MGDRTTRALGHAATMISGLVVLGVISMPAWSKTIEIERSPDATALIANTSEATAQPDGPGRSVGIGKLELGGPSVEDVRELPLLDPNGTVSTVFPGGEGLDDEQLVRETTSVIIEDAGLPPEAADALWSAMENEMGAIRSDQLPYDYPAFAQFETYLTDDVVASRAGELQDLAALLALAAGSSPTPDDQFLAVNKGLVAAQVVLERVATVDLSCDSRTMRAWAVTMGDSPSSGVLEDVWQQAIEACPGDPSPRWWWGHRLLEDSISSSLFIEGDRTRTEALQEPIDFFEGWVADGGGAVAHAGLAETLLSQAEALQLAGAMPFAVRDYAMRAREVFEQLEAGHPSPSASLAVVRAAYVAGDDDVSELVEALDEESMSPAARQTATFIYERLGEFEEAAAVAAPESPDPASLMLVPTNRHELLPPTWAHAIDARATTPFDATFDEGGGGDVAWLGIVPEYRESPRFTTVSSGMPMCRAHVAAMNLVFAGRYDDARGVDLSTDAARHPYCGYITSPSEAADRIEFGSSDVVSWDGAQNLLRYAGDLDLADSMIDAWLAAGENPLARQRQGEVAFLAEDWEEAIAAFSVAAATSEGVTIDEFGTSWTADNVRESWLMLGLAEERAGQAEAALDAYSTAIQIGPANTAAGSADESALAAAHARTAALLTERGDMASSLPHRRAAAEVASAYDDNGLGWDDRDVLNTFHPLSSGAEYNNYAVGLLDLGRQPKEARHYAQLAVDLDPLSPVFTDTLGQTQQRSGDTDAAEKTYEQAVERDSTTFQSLNNRAVIQAQQGRLDAAIDSLQAAISAKPDYAIAWFNLGVVQAERGSLKDFAESQASFARAVRLDGDLRDVPARLSSDTSAFQTDLDLARSVAPEWTLGGAARSTTQSIGWILVALALVRLLLSLGFDKVAEIGVSRVLSPSPGRGHLSRTWHVVDRTIPVVVAVLVTAAIAAWPLLGSATAAMSTVLTTLVISGAVTCLFVAASGGRRRGWLPSMVLGASTAVVGYSLVPAPVDARTEASVRQRWGGVAAVGVLAVTALTIAYATGMPSVRWVGLVALGLLTTSLLPLRPFDGAQPMPRVLSIVVAVVLLVVSGGVAMAWW